MPDPEGMVFKILLSVVPDLAKACDDFLEDKGIDRDPRQTIKLENELIKIVTERYKEMRDENEQK